MARLAASASARAAFSSASAARGLCSLRLGDVVHGQKDQGRLAVRREHTACVEEHCPPPDRLEVLLDLEAFDDALARQDLLQERP